jgi:hypothetical protein
MVARMDSQKAWMTAMCKPLAVWVLDPPTSTKCAEQRARKIAFVAETDAFFLIVFRMNNCKILDYFYSFKFEI